MKRGRTGVRAIVLSRGERARGLKIFKPEALRIRFFVRTRLISELHALAPARSMR